MIYFKYRMHKVCIFFTMYACVSSTTCLSKMSHRLCQLFLFLSCIMQLNAEGISCFKCTVFQSHYEKDSLLCSHFDGSSKFQVFCPSSTLCMKKTIYYATKTSVTTAVQRDCAPQNFISKTYKDGQWFDTQEVVKTAYEEGCFRGEDKGTPAEPPEYCFCSYHLCNSARMISIVQMSFEQYLVLLVPTLSLLLLI